MFVLFPLGKITLSDLKRCRMAHIFFDTFFNLEKYLDHEQRDPFAVQKVQIFKMYLEYSTITVDLLDIVMIHSKACMLGY